MGQAFCGVAKLWLCRNCNWHAHGLTVEGAVCLWVPLEPLNSKGVDPKIEKG